MQSLFWIYGSLNLLAALLFGLVAGKWWAGSQRKISMVAASLAAVGFSVFMLGHVDPASIPIDWITPLQEGRSQKNIEQIFGSAAHARTNYHFFVHLFAGDHGIRGVVRMNLWLFGLALLLFWTIARHMLDTVWGATLALLLPGLNLVAVHLPLSPQPSALIALYMGMVFAAGALFEKKMKRQEGQTWLPLSLLAVLGVLLAGTRQELALIPFTALGLACLRLWFGDDKLDQVPRLIGRGLLWFLRSPWPWLLLGFRLLPQFIHSHFRWGLRAFEPFNLSPLTLPFVMHQLLFPFSVCLLVALGAVYSLRNWRVHLLLPVSLLVVYRAYYEAACSIHYELLRYLGYLLIPIAFLALVGLLEFRRILERFGLASRWLSLAPLLLILFTDVSPTSVIERYPFIDAGESEINYHIPLTRDTQRETRLVLKAVEAYPHCQIVSKVARSERYRPGTKETFHYFVINNPNRPRSRTIQAATAREAAAQLEPNSCKLYYRSLDCNLLGVEELCEEPFLMERPVMEERFARNQYNNPAERGATLPVVTLGLYEIDMREDSGPSQGAETAEDSQFSAAPEGALPLARGISAQD